jgi:hypothetical protein
MRIQTGSRFDYDPVSMGVPRRRCRSCSMACTKHLIVTALVELPKARERLAAGAG